jgi:hypothetical protein
MGLSISPRPAHGAPRAGGAPGGCQSAPCCSPRSRAPCARWRPDRALPVAVQRVARPPGAGTPTLTPQGAALRMSLMPVAGQRSPDFPVPARGLRRARASRPPREQMSASGPASLQRSEAPGCSSYIFASDAEPFLSALVRSSPTSTRRCQRSVFTTAERPSRCR